MAGNMLVDHEIVTAIKTGRIKLTNLDYDLMDITSSESPVQPSSLDLRIGEIFLPKIDELDLDSRPSGETGYQLKAGQSVVVETLEELTLDKSISGFCFPPARLARDGLLMTNPGHVDPGFSGKLTFTLINFSREICSLRHGQAIGTFLFFDVGEGPEVPYADRKKPKDSSGNKIARILKNLSPDFANFSERAERIAKTEVEKAKLDLELKKVIWPAAIGAVIALAGFLGSQILESSTNVTNEELELEVQELRAFIEAEILKEASGIGDRLEPLEQDLIRQNATADFLEIRERLTNLEQSLRATE